MLVYMCVCMPGVTLSLPCFVVQGLDERISVDNLARISAFYASVVTEACGPSSSS